MSLKRKNIVSVFVIFVFLLSSLMVSEQNNVYACSCSMSPGSFEDELADSDYVFDGIITNKKEKISLLGSISTADPVEWTFQLNGSWKGEVTEVMTVYSALSSVSCGYEFEVGKRYAVFARDVDSRIEVSHCSKTMKIADNSDIFTDLGPYKDEFNVPPIDEVVGDLDDDPNPRIVDNSNVMNEEGDLAVALVTTTDQIGSSPIEGTTQSNVFEKINLNGIITFVLVFIILIVVARMRMYRKSRK